LGATTLKDLALALFIGLLAGTYSSMFVATPILAMLKEREPKYRNVREKLERDRSRAVVTPAATPVLADGIDDGTASQAPTPRQPASTSTANRPRAGTKKASRRRRGR
jgi:preprotein translocase subunit SecF